MRKSLKTVIATFSSKSDHTMKVSLGKVETAGDACVGISSKGIFGYKSLDSETFYLKKGNYASTYYKFNFDDISKGTRYYSFSADTNTKYTVSSYSDSW